MHIELPLNDNLIGNIDVIFLTGDVTIPLATEICKELISIEYRNNNTNKYPPVRLIINSAGGDLYATWMICDIMAGMKTPVQTYALGQVASGGFIIFMSGTKGLRMATNNTQFMSHRYSMSYEANHANIKSQQPELDRIHSRMIDHYKKCTDLSLKYIEKFLLTEHDVWLTAEKCQELGICDIIVDTSSKSKLKPKKKK
jgi:ATP-dependent Clp protease protease subunit